VIVQHRHHKGKKQHKERPSHNRDSLAAMSGAYGVPIQEESKRQQSRHMQGFDEESDGSEYV